MDVLISILGVVFLFCGINLKDVNWIKVYKNKQILNLNLFMKTSLLESEICSKLILNKKIPIQITSNYLPRKYGKSKVTNLKRLSKVIYEIPKLIFVILIFRISKLFTVKQKIKR